MADDGRSRERILSTRRRRRRLDPLSRPKHRTLFIRFVRKLATHLKCFTSTLIIDPLIVCSSSDSCSRSNALLSTMAAMFGRRRRRRHLVKRTLTNARYRRVPRAIYPPANKRDENGINGRCLIHATTGVV